MFIIDFDDTLFNTHAFKQARLKALERIGVSSELFWATYRNARVNNDSLFTYSDKRHAEILGSEGFDEDEVLAIFKKIMANLKSFLAPDAEVFLNKLKALGQPLILLSLGDPEYQELKVKGCGVENFFERIFFVDKTKEQVLEEIISSTHDTEYWLINDKIDESRQLSLKFPDLKIILKVSPSFTMEAYKESGLTYFQSLEEIFSYVKN